MNEKQNQAREWFLELRNKLTTTLEKIDKKDHNFKYKNWEHSGSGGGTMGLLKGNIIEKAGVNISTVSGNFNDKMRSRIPGTKTSPKYWATGISVVIHPLSPLIPSMHFNSRYLQTDKQWFGGGVDITPALEFKSETLHYHSILKKACMKHDSKYYDEHKKWCDEYFFLKHRNEPRGIGGIFFDYEKKNWEKDFKFVRDLGIVFLKISNKIIQNKIHLKYNNIDKEKQLIKRGRYVEFNLLYDRGTKFGLNSGGNTEAILMSLPPDVKW